MCSAVKYYLYYVTVQYYRFSAKKFQQSVPYTTFPKQRHEDSAVKYCLHSVNSLKIVILRMLLLSIPLSLAHCLSLSLSLTQMYLDCQETP